MKSLDRSWSRQGIVQWIRAASRSRSTARRTRRFMLEGLEPRALLTTIIEYPISNSTAVPTEITTGSDGNLWFVDQTSNAIGRINATSHVIDYFSNGLPANASPMGITSGPNGKLWFTEARYDALVSLP